MNDNITIYSINGPVVKVKNADDLKMQETVYVGNKRLIGEVISNSRGEVTIQVYESTTGLKTGEPIVRTGKPMSVTLAPGIIGNIFDGIERPLKALESISSPYIETGCDVEKTDTEKKYNVKITVSEGDTVERGRIYATCPETSRIEYRAPSPCSGKVVYAAPDGEYTVKDILVRVLTASGDTEELSLTQEWPIRVPRPVGERLPLSKPLITGQRNVDTMFPIAKGGAAAIPGGFGTGKTMHQHQLAKWSDADIIVYIGCGERGNEMTQVLEEFSGLIDPKTGTPLSDRTVLIANTSNMPVAAREASIYTGITIAEYYRDMGYDVAIMADSTSRWAEALREISGRLEEMPAEEGYPAYLPSRLAEFYERGGYVRTLGGEEASITIIGAVSPQGSDFSEPVTQNTKRFVSCFWALDKSLAYARHYPAINWMTSYSEYIDPLSSWYNENVNANFMKYRGRILRLLNEEDQLMEIVKLIGADVLPDSQRLVIEISKVIRVGFLQQNAMHQIDTYMSIERQFKMMDIILYLYDEAQKIVARAVPISQLIKTGVFDSVIRLKFEIKEDDESVFETKKKEIDEAFSAVIEENFGSK
ncbi:MAG: V-type ATP synthase subunit A [Eubacteriales bacterium]|nr:V-type ATP synthase subunit A [Eubacteriales bacterium]